MKQLILFLVVILFSACEKDNTCNNLWIEKTNTTTQGVFLTPYDCNLSEIQNLQTCKPPYQCKIIYIP
jgi:hypothetical protein